MKTLNPEYQTWAEEAIKNGWNVLDESPVRGPRETDASIQLTKNGALVWLVSYDFFPNTGGKSFSYDSSHGWSAEGYAIEVPFPFVLDFELVEANRCDSCKQIRPKEDIRRVAFTGKVCGNCDSSDVPVDLESRS